jgi:toxin HigB-1
VASSFKLFGFPLRLNHCPYAKTIKQIDSFVINISRYMDFRLTRVTIRDTIQNMIRTFKNRALKKLYEKGDPSKINADHINRVEDILFRLDNAVKPSDMDWPGWKLHPLKGKHKGFWAVWVSGNYRIWYRFEDGDTFDVDYGDYH